MVTHVAVRPAGARRKEQRDLGVDRQQFLVAPVAREVEVLVRVGESRGMRQQLANGDVLPCRRCARQVLGDVVVEREFAVLDQQHHQRGGELLAGRARLVDRLRRRRHAVFEVGETEPGGEDHFAVIDQCQASPRQPLAIELLLQRGEQLALVERCAATTCRRTGASGQTEEQTRQQHGSAARLEGDHLGWRLRNANGGSSAAAQKRRSARTGGEPCQRHPCPGTRAV